MNLAAINSATGATNSASGQNLNQITGNDFLTLLTAQLKSQDPTQPMDPTQFVGQLVQFNSLQQLIDMNQSLQRLAAGANISTGAQQTAPAVQPSAAPSSSHHGLVQTLTKTLGALLPV